MRTITKLMQLAAAVTLSAFALSFAGSPALAWPERTVKFIVPIGPGAGVDISARLFADRLARKWGRSVVVENRPGGDAIVAITTFVTANDDHTLLFAPAGAFTAHPYLHEKVPYDRGDLSPIARVTSTIVAVAVPASLNVKSVADLIAMARAQPGKLNWASATGLNEFLFAGYLQDTGLSMTKISYRDTVSAINDLGEGRIDVYIGAYAIVRSQAEAGRVKVLAMTNRDRAVSAPEIPTVKEAGFPELGFDGLAGLFGPRRMPNDVRDRIAADIRTIATDPEIISRLTATGQIIVPGTAAEFAAAITEQYAQIAAVGKALGIKPAQ